MSTCVCNQQWIEITDQHGRYFRRCICWHLDKMKYRMARGCSKDLAYRLMDMDIRSFLPPRT